MLIEVQLLHFLIVSLILLGDSYIKIAPCLWLISKCVCVHVPVCPTCTYTPFRLDVCSSLS